MSEDVRMLIDQSCVALRKSKICNNNVMFHDVLSATGKRLKVIINEFLDTVERINVRDESEIPAVVISTYNVIVDRTVEVDPKEPLINVPIKNIEFTRTLQCYRKTN